MLRQGLVHEARSGAYWLDTEAYAAAEEARRRRITLVFGIIAIILAMVMLIGYRFRV
jgi:hypothetical protein